MKEDFFLKFKDYNKELERILEKKDFSKDTKNLLLSMFYKLDISYNDYSTVKRKCKTKEEYLENVLENIRNINKIELIKPSSDKFEILKNNGLYEIDYKLKKIKVIANELALLSSILELNNFQVYLKEEYNLIRNSMPYLINMAYDMESLEILRDFNAWSWNILINEIKDIDINLIYQNLKIALNFDIFNKIRNENELIDIIEIIKEELVSLYDEKTAEKFLKLIFKISILIYVNVNSNERKRLKEEKESLEIDIEEVKDKKKYIEKITEQKKKLIKDLKDLDLILNNKELLFIEYEKRNKKLSQYNKIFSISHLSDIIQNERKKILDKINTCNKKIEPKNYLEYKNKLQSDYNLLSDINFDEKNDVKKYIKKIQKIFIKDILPLKIKNIDNKSDLIDYAYQLRYYNFLPYNENESINQIKDLKLQLNNIEEELIKKLYNNKIINTISTSEKNDIKIVKEIFNLKVINLEDIYLQIRKKDNKYLIKIYDDKETIEKEIDMELEFNKKDKIKLNKKIKLFI